MNTVGICGEESSTSQARASEKYVIFLIEFIVTLPRYSQKLAQNLYLYLYLAFNRGAISRYPLSRDESIFNLLAISFKDAPLLLNRLSEILRSHQIPVVI
jgi:hypothetical protein